MKSTTWSQRHEVNVMKSASWSQRHEVNVIKSTSWSKCHEVNVMAKNWRGVVFNAETDVVKVSPWQDLYKSRSDRQTIQDQHYILGMWAVSLKSTQAMLEVWRPIMTKAAIHI